ncbi:MAG: hypothetical protein HYZ57_04795 [Acidobacteria bacterium]|nr:hypothetical protein [Acidobacteriota bacterium]MBI3279142.1 hypothetical protein [Acidobacteriota bacterium]
MTKVQLRFELQKDLDDRKLMDSIARVHGVYGIFHVLVTPDMRSLLIEYDASRLNPLEAESVLHQAGVPIVLSGSPPVSP